MIFDINAKPVIDQLSSASEAEAVATKALLSAMENGVRDTKILEALTNQMTAAHNKKMDIWDQLQPLRLDQ